MDDVVLRAFQPDDAAWLVEQHGVLYARDEGFDDSFAPLVARILDGFVTSHDPIREKGWIVEQAGQRLGSIFCVSVDQHTAKLRLFLLVPEARGKGVGKRLLETCTDFAREAGYQEMVLWTHESHTAACALYRAFGWELTGSKPVLSFGVDLVEQSWKFRL
ncbi:GNAT family N-acetyltransferase [Ruegeria sp. 6PALISEP08]|uniref:GNAT family N-acetyltransferase n=1 Tax=Ruegeria sp. 6PALISEP08 TaxID=1225660 RepID=UPI00067EDE6D|nr:GNAT family N-acetyltransferase [Ruegeria sp. 6PALISEP08]